MSTVSWKPRTPPPPEVEPEPTRIPGHVYVVQMEGFPYYKIGHTIKLSSRMSAFGVLLPFRHRLLFTRKVSDSRHLEQILHRELEAQRMNGEWFRLSAEDLNAVDACLLYAQGQDLIERAMRAFMEDLNSKGFPGMARWARLFLRLQDRDERRIATWAALSHRPTRPLHVVSDIIFARSFSKEGSVR